MASYRGLGNRRVTSVLDTTGNNSGNWTTILDAATLAITKAQFELYKAVVSNVTAGGAATCYLDDAQWSYVAPAAGGSEWDPSQPLLINPGQALYFYWNLPADSTPAPQLTAFFRYDTDQWG